jgi:hypothetical protein
MVYLNQLELARDKQGRKEQNKDPKTNCIVQSVLLTTFFSDSALKLRKAYQILNNNLVENLSFVYP